MWCVRVDAMYVCKLHAVLINVSEEVVEVDLPTIS